MEYYVQAIVGSPYNFEMRTTMTKALDIHCEHLRMAFQKEGWGNSLVFRKEDLVLALLVIDLHFACHGEDDFSLEVLDSGFAFCAI